MQPIILRWLEAVLETIPNVLTAFIILLASWFLARLAARIVDDMMERRRLSSGVAKLVSHALYWTILVTGLLTALGRFFDVTAFIAGLGIVGFAVGFALQDVMKNFAAGVILVLQQPFRVGEAISVAGFDGTILAIDLRATEMSTFDGRLVSIPNATILTSPITNFTRAARRRVDIPLQLPPGTDVQAARRLLLEAILATPGVVKDPPPSVTLQQVGGPTTDLAGSFWVDVSRANPDAARDEVLTRVEPQLPGRTVPAAPTDGNGAQPG